MEMRAGLTPATGELSARLIHGDGTVEDLGVISTDKPVKWKTRLGYVLILLAAYGLVHLVHSIWAWLFALGVVTNAGVNYMASDFASGGSAPTISGFKYHDSGTGTNSPAVGDTGLQTPAGPARVIGTPSNPSANQYRSVATIAYTGSLAITEWGLFSASSGVTLWDRRTFAAINVVNGDSIQFTYTLTVNSGGT